MNEPCGTPHFKAFFPVIPAVNRTGTPLLCRKDFVHQVILSGHPCIIILLINRLCRTASKAPYTSRVTKVNAQPWNRATSISWTMHEARSVAARLGSAPNSYLPTTSLTMARRAI